MDETASPKKDLGFLPAIGDEFDGLPIVRELGLAKDSIIIPDWEAFYAASAEIAACINWHKFDSMNEITVEPSA